MSVTVSLMLLAYIILPGIFPREHQVLVGKRLLPTALLVALIGLFIPIGTLYWATREESADKDDDSDNEFYF